MHVVSIYTNKGGDGKSTITVGLAEFLSGNRGKKVLVIDLDAQASSASALLGRQAKRAAVKSGQTSVKMAMELIETKKVEDLERYIIRRPAVSTKGSALGEISVMVPTGPDLDEVEKRLTRKGDARLFLKYLKPALREFDYVLIDFPGNVRSARDKVCMNALVMSDFVLVPVKATDMSLDGLDVTFQNIDWAQKMREPRGLSVLGFMLSCTDRRFQQYRATFPKILAEVKEGNLPPIFNCIWPPSPALQTATSHDPNFATLKERFGVCYEHARKAAIEFEERCNGHDPEAPQPSLIRSVLERIGIV